MESNEDGSSLPDLTVPQEQCHKNVKQEVDDDLDNASMALDDAINSLRRAGSRLIQNNASRLVVVFLFL